IGTPGPAGRDGTLRFPATRKRATKVRRGRIVRISFRAHNDTTARIPRSTARSTVPKGPKFSGRLKPALAALRAGQARTLTARLRIGRRARLGTHAVTVRVKVGGGKTVTRKVRLRVVR